MSVDWNERYRVNDTPWDKGEPHPELSFLLETHRDFFDSAQTILVPGCGKGHDCHLIASELEASSSVTGLDLAEAPLKWASEHYPDPVFKKGNLFDWEGIYDLIFEHTCFCAIQPSDRPEYVQAAKRLLRPGGYLIGIFFLNPDHPKSEGPPFGVTLEELDQFFGEDFELIWSQEPGATFDSREGEGRERSMVWRRRP